MAKQKPGPKSDLRLTIYIRVAPWAVEIIDKEAKHKRLTRSRVMGDKLESWANTVLKKRYD